MRDVLPSGTLLRDGSYRVDYALGRGGFGITYRAIDLGLEMLVAIKEFYPQEQAIRNSTNGGFSVAVPQREAYGRALERFKREGRILARLNHNNVVRVLSLFEERDTAYLVMELIAGKTLRDELDAQSQKKMPQNRVEQVMAQLVSALEAVHQKEIYHLDLKPDNVLLMPDGKVVLVDFGAARQSLGSHSTRAYTIGYAAPEVIAGSVVGVQSDIFSLGMMLHEMLTGELPPPALSRLIKDNWKPQGLEERWQSLVTAALPIDPEQRPNNVRQWLQSLSSPAQPNPPSSFPSLLRAERSTLWQSQPLKPKVELISAVGVDYTHLRDLLAAGKWRDADKETRTIMLKVACREEEGWFDENSIENFPCDDLGTINQLWLNYSNGRFGFSVQKQIWLNCGGKIDKKTECLLGDSLGWRVNNRWIYPNAIMYSLDAPTGHLPLGGGGLGLMRSFLLFFFRVQSCQL